MHALRALWGPCKGRRALHVDRMQLNLPGNAPQNRELRRPRVVTGGSALACLTPSRKGSVRNRASLLFEEAGWEISGEHNFQRDKCKLVPCHRPSAESEAFTYRVSGHTSGTSRGSCCRILGGTASFARKGYRGTSSIRNGFYEKQGVFEVWFS